MMRKVSVWFATAFLALGLCSVALAAVPGVIPYQGKLTDAAGTPINGTQSIVFSLFTALTGGVAAYTETQPTVAVANGLFSVDIGSVTPLPPALFTGGDLFLEIKVGSDPAMAPRQRLGSVAYAQRAGITAGVANSSDPGGVLGSATNLTSTTATFPAAGFAVVLASVELSVSIPAGTVNCFGISINDISATIHSSTQCFQCEQAPAAGGIFREDNSSVFRVFPVTAGQTKTFFLVGNQQSGSWSLFRARLVVMFVTDAIGATTNNEPQNAPAGPAGAHRVGTTIQ